MSYRLLEQFAATFEGTRYRHRDSSLGDRIAVQLYEDLYEIGKSGALAQRIGAGQRVVNARNVRRGVRARRGDGTFGELVPGADARSVQAFAVERGQVATVEIGTEVKILAKAMIKQIDRVISVLRRQADHFRLGMGNPICVAVIGINQADHYTSYEGDRAYPTDGRRYKHPAQEATEAEARLLAEAAPRFDEFLLLRFLATNVPPHPFVWRDGRATALDYGAILTRISREYDRRFGASV